MKRGGGMDGYEEEEEDTALVGQLEGRGERGAEKMASALKHNV